MAEITIEPELVEIDKAMIERFLRIVPEQDLGGLKEIEITYSECPFEPACYYPRQSKVEILIDPDFWDSIWGIRTPEDIARAIFHEIGHHTQYKSPHWRKIRRKIGKHMTESSIFESFANSYAEEKLKKLKQMDPDSLSPYARTRSLIQTRLGEAGRSG